MLLRECGQLVFRIHIVPYLLHVVPVVHYAVFHGILDGEEAAMLLRLRSDEYVTFQRTGHNAYMFGPTDAEITRVLWGG